MLLANLRVRTRPVCAAVALLVTVAPAAHAAIDCDINVYQAYETARLRGWGFTCAFSNLPLAKATLMPFGPTIGCVIDTPPGPWPTDKNPTLHFFSKQGATLKNGWTMKGFEISGAQWSSAYSNPTYLVLVAAQLKGLQPAKKYQVKVARLTLSKSGGTCANAINEAF